MLRVGQGPCSILVQGRATSISFSSLLLGKSGTSRSVNDLGVWCRRGRREVALDLPLRGAGFVLARPSERAVEESQATNFLRLVLAPCRLP